MDYFSTFCAPLLDSFAGNSQVNGGTESRKEVVRIYDCGKEKPSLENIYFNTLLLRIPFYFKIVHVLILPSLFKCPS